MGSDRQFSRSARATRESNFDRPLKTVEIGSRTGLGGVTEWIAAEFAPGFEEVRIFPGELVQPASAQATTADAANAILIILPRL